MCTVYIFENEIKCEAKLKKKTAVQRGPISKNECDLVPKFIRRNEIVLTADRQIT